MTRPTINITEELEQALRNVQYVLFQEFESDGFETTYRERCVGCGRLSSEGCKSDCLVQEALRGGDADATEQGAHVEGRFLPRKESK